MDVATEYFGPAYGMTKHTATQTKEELLEEIKREIKECRKNAILNSTFSSLDPSVTTLVRKGKKYFKIVTEDSDTLSFLTPPMVILNITTKFGKKIITCKSHVEAFQKWAFELDSEVNEVIDDLDLALRRSSPVSPTDDNDGFIIQASRFTHKFGSDVENPILIYDLDHNLSLNKIDSQDLVQLKLTARPWLTEKSVGWGLNVDFIVQHTHGVADAGDAGEGEGEGEGEAGEAGEAAANYIHTTYLF